MNMRRKSIPDKRAVMVSALEEESMAEHELDEFAEEFFIGDSTDVENKTPPESEADKNHNAVNEEGKKRKRKRILMRFLCVLVGAFLFLILGFGYSFMRASIPDRVKILVNQKEKIDVGIPVEISFYEDNIGVLSVNESNIPAGELHINLQEPFTLCAEEKGCFLADVKLFGFIELKRISVEAIDSMEVIPCGKTVGILIETNGALVLGTGNVTGRDGTIEEPAKNIVKTGDYIQNVNGVRVNGKEELIKELQKDDNEYATLTVLRGENVFCANVKKIKTAKGDYKIGVWVRDDTQGIGTLTYVTTNGDFGALGHGIADVDTGVLLNIAEGILYDARILSITKGRSGKPGELVGMIEKAEENRIGSVRKNTAQGVFGKIPAESTKTEELLSQSQYGVMPVGLRQQVHKGKASVLCEVSGSLQEYEIEIEDVDYGNKKLSKSMVIRITDDRLIDLTGGIVQGMSGSPILQDGKLIGAVTHVFINNEKRGYGIFIENMLENNK